MSGRYLVEYRPTKRTKDRPWVILLEAHPKPMVVGRAETEAQAHDAAGMVGLERATELAVAADALWEAIEKVAEFDPDSEPRWPQ